MGREEHLPAADMIKNNAYIDDLVGSKRIMEEALDLTRDVDHIFKKVVLM